MGAAGYRADRFSYGAVLQACGRAKTDKRSSNSKKAQAVNVGMQYFEQAVRDRIEMHSFLLEWLKQTVGPVQFEQLCRTHQIQIQSETSWSSNSNRSKQQQSRRPNSSRRN